MSELRVFACEECGKECKEDSRVYDNVDWCQDCCHKEDQRIINAGKVQGFLWQELPRYVR